MKLSRKRFWGFVLFCILAIASYFYFKDVSSSKTIPSSTEEMLQSLSNRYKPTVNDYKKIQAYLSLGNREELLALQDFAPRMRNFKLFTKGLRPEHKKVCVNCSSSYQKRCVVLYTSYNGNYPAALKSSVESIQGSDFKGHIIYHIGGWPNCEEGDLDLVCTPYAFKIAALREAKRLGYQNVLWLDASITSLAPLNSLFEKIEQDGYLTVGNTHCVGPYFNKSSAASLSVNYDECFQIPSVSAGILGLNFHNEHANELLTRWYLAAKDPHAFFSARSDQNVLSVLLYQMHMPIQIPYSSVAENTHSINSSSVFLLDREKTRKVKVKKKSSL